LNNKQKEAWPRLHFVTTGFNPLQMENNSTHQLQIQYGILYFIGEKKICTLVTQRITICSLSQSTQ